MCISDILEELVGGKWEEVDGPDSGCGIDMWFQNENLDEIYVNDDQGFLTISMDGNTIWTGDRDEFND